MVCGFESRLRHQHKLQMAKTHIISFCTDESRARILRSSAAAQGFDVVILTAPAWEGYHQKLLHARDYVVEHLALDDLLLFADAYDVIFNRNLHYSLYGDKLSEWLSSVYRSAGNGR
jgi:hypothetical protein